MIIISTVVQLVARVMLRYRASYYAAVYSGQVHLQHWVAFGRNTSVTISPKNKSAQLTIGGATTFRKDCTITLDASGMVTIGKGCFFNNGCSINCLGSIEIGEDTLFGEGVKLYDHNHVFNKKDFLIKDQGFSIGKIKIGKNCWIGSSCIILKNVEIGDNVVIGAGCIIASSVPSNTIVRPTIQVESAPLQLR
jgi:acetyltransferase-like isoleucine patch superfamily enzyme